MSDGIEKRLDQLLSFPVLTRELGTGGSGSGGTASPGGGTAAGQIVEAALRDVLGWRPRSGDPRGFVAALNQSFACGEVGGKSVCKWTPRSYAVSVQANLGALTGAQASLHARARNVADQVTPLLDGLEAMIPDADEADVESTLAIVRSCLTELVNELGLLGGPRVPRVDDLFIQLLGGAPRAQSPEQVRGQLGILRDRLGLNRSRINTVEDEQNYTNFLLIVDHILSLDHGWQAQRSEFTRTSSTAFFGTQLILVSRQLAVIAESVNEYYTVLDSLFLGPAERETVLLSLGDPTDPTVLTIAELYGWVESFVSEEGPRLLQDGGIDGVKSFQTTLLSLTELVSDAVALAQQPSNNPTPAFHDLRALSPSQEVLFGLETVATQVAAITEAVLPSPGGKLKVSDFDLRSGSIPEPPAPDVAPPTLKADVEGDGFDSHTWISLGRDVVVRDVSLGTGDQLVVKLSLEPDATGVKDLVVVDSQGRVAWLPDALVILKTATDTSNYIRKISGSRGRVGEKVKVAVWPRGSFPIETELQLRKGDATIDALNPDRSPQGTTMTCTFDLTGAEEGKWDVIAISRDQGLVTHELVDGFTVLPAKSARPRITSARRIGTDGSDLVIQVRGSGFTPSSTVSLGEGMQILETEVSGDFRRIRATVRVLSGAEGSKPAVVINPDGQIAVLPDALSIAADDEP
jgi:hypothetical protein